jgi:hypothetical protein
VTEQGISQKAIEAAKAVLETEAVLPFMARISEVGPDRIAEADADAEARNDAFVRDVLAAAIPELITDEFLQRMAEHLRFLGWNDPVGNWPTALRATFNKVLIWPTTGGPPTPVTTEDES